MLTALASSTHLQGSLLYNENQVSLSSFQGSQELCYEYNTEHLQADKAKKRSPFSKTG